MNQDSSEEGRLIDGVAVGAVEKPGDYESVARILKTASTAHCAVVPLGGGTMMDLGAPLRRPDLVLSLENLARVLDYQPANLTVKTQGGISLGALNRELAKHGQYLPLDPPFPERATIGGVLATNSSGGLRVRFGSARDLVLGLRVALADGQIVHGGGDVVKNVAGYDLPKLIVGSLGTLGVILEATLKIVPLPLRTETFIAGFDLPEDAFGLALRVMQSPLLPYSIQILNPSAGLRLGLEERFACVVRFGGLESAVSQQVRQVEQWSQDLAGIKSNAIGDENELAGRLRDFIFEGTTVVKIGLVPTRLGSAFARAQELADLYGLGCLMSAQAIGILFVAFEGEPSKLEAVISDLRRTVIGYGGHLVIQRANRELRERVGVWGPEPPSVGLMRKLKQELDPDGILNPGRFVGGF